MSATDTEGFVIEPAQQPAYRLPYNGAAMQAAHASECPHRRTYVVAGRRFCNACGDKVGSDCTCRRGTRDGVPYFAPDVDCPQHGGM